MQPVNDICEFCGYSPLEGGRYSCPNCEGEGLEDMSDQATDKINEALKIVEYNLQVLDISKARKLSINRDDLLTIKAGLDQALKHTKKES